MAGYIAGPYSKTIKAGKIPAGKETRREVITIMNILDKLADLRGRMGSEEDEAILTYALASPEEQKAIKRRLIEAK